MSAPLIYITFPGNARKRWASTPASSGANWHCTPTPISAGRTAPPTRWLTACSTASSRWRGRMHQQGRRLSPSKDSCCPCWERLNRSFSVDGSRNSPWEGRCATPYRPSRGVPAMVRSSTGTASTGSSATSPSDEPTIAHPDGGCAEYMMVPATPGHPVHQQSAVVDPGCGAGDAPDRARSPCHPARSGRRPDTADPD
jgi:hypothetical protein